MSTFCMWIQIELQSQQFCAQSMIKLSTKVDLVLINYSLFTNFISIDAIVHKTLILYEIVVGTDKDQNLETIFQVYTFLYTL